MKIPLGTPLAIVAYRDFHDVPRLILASDQDASFWVLDSPFDDDTDEYSPSYEIFFVGRDLFAAKQALELWSNRSTGLSIGAIAVDRVRFDDSRRKALTCM